MDPQFKVETAICAGMLRSLATSGSLSVEVRVNNSGRLWSRIVPGTYMRNVLEWL